MLQQFRFLTEIDKLKQVFRQTYLLDGSRQENDAEHSWHLAMLVLTLGEYADEPIDLLRVLKMVLIHDIVEIDAGDTFIYDAGGHLDKAERETRAADRLFGLLPGDQQSELRSLWEEFEARQSADARFAGAVDRVQPVLHNCLTGGLAWKAHGIQLAQVLGRCRDPIRRGSRQLWSHMEGLLREAVALGHLRDDSEGQAWG